METSPTLKVLFGLGGVLRIERRDDGDFGVSLASELGSCYVIATAEDLDTVRAALLGVVLDDRERDANRLEAHLLDGHNQHQGARFTLAELREGHAEAHRDGLSAYPHLHTGDAR